MFIKSEKDNQNLKGFHNWLCRCKRYLGGKQYTLNVSVRLKEKGGHDGIRNMKSKRDE
jgi:hypothetical protein